ncbi:MAG: serine hydrolase [Bacteroidota bacterium]
MKIIHWTLLLCFLSIHLNAQELYFPPNFSEEWETTSLEELNWCEENVADFDVFLEETNTKACIILKDGKIAHESYFDDFDLGKSWYWASAGKTITSTMIGILQEEGALSITDKTSQYLGESWTNCDELNEEKITIWHQLTMTSGLDYTVDDNFCFEPECLLCLNEPGEEWFYHNAPYSLLSYVIESASEQGYTAVTNSKLTNRIGFIGLWTNANSGRLFFSTARGMARFGLLMLNSGNWDGEDVITDKEYLNDMINTSQEINKAYGYLWWLNGKESYRLPGTTITFPGKIIQNAPDDLYAAIGKNGQILMVVPSENLVVVRMGNNPDNSLVPTTYVNELWNEYEKLSCTVSSDDTEQIDFSVRPKLAWNRIWINSDQDFDAIRIFDTSGNLLVTTREQKINVSDLAKGLYFVQATKGRKSVTQKFFKY